MVREPLFERIRNPQCKECELHKTAQSVCLIGDGLWPADIMIVGEAPGLREDSIRKPFAGKAGRLLDGILEACSLKRAEIYISNAVKCRPPENRKPKAYEIDQCQPYLQEEIKLVKPKVIICLGAIAIKAVLGKGAPNVMKARGKVFDAYNTKVIGTYHPAHALRGNSHTIEYILNDIKRALKIAGGHKNPELDVNYAVINQDNFEYIKAKLKNKKVIGFDVETTSLDMFDPKEKLLSIAFSPKPGVAYFLPVEHSKSTLSIDQVSDFTNTVLNGDKVIVGHNVKFDLKWIAKKLGVLPLRARVRDTMVLYSLIDENYPDKGLKHLVRIFTPLGPHLDKWEEKAKVQKVFTTDTDIRDLCLYNCGDSDGTRRLYSKFLSQIKEEGLLNLMKIQGEATKMFTDIELNGFKIDEDKRKELIKDHEKKIYELELTLKKGYRPDLNLNSSQQVCDILYRQLELPILETTEKGAPSAAEATLKSLVASRIPKEAKNWINSLLEYRSTVKEYNTYLINLPVKEDECIHADYRQSKNQSDEANSKGGTVTGRLSCKNPNLQQIPRQGLIKIMYVSRFRRGRLLQGDYSQIELRGLAHVSGDTNLLKAFMEDFDLHRWVASMANGTTMEEVTEEERKKAKTVNFGIAYCISVFGLAKKGNMSVKEAKKMMGIWKTRFKTAVGYVDKIQRIAERDKEVINDFGRRRRFANVDRDTDEGRESLRQSVNFPIQSLASDITVFSMIQLWKWLKETGKKSLMIGNVHDACLVDCPPNEYLEVGKKMKEIFENPPLPFKMRCPLKLEVKAGFNWKEMAVILD